MLGNSLLHVVANDIETKKIIRLSDWMRCEYENISPCARSCCLLHRANRTSRQAMSKPGK